MSLLWDQHACLPLEVGADVHQLNRFDNSRPTYVSVNAGYSPHSFAQTVALLDYFRSAVNVTQGMALAASVDDVLEISARGDIAIGFDLEDSAPLDGDLDNLGRLADLGVRTMLPTYNHQNRAGGGCLDAADGGLTPWGADLVRHMNEVGVVPDGSHCGRRTALDMSGVTAAPMIYSHSCMNSVWEHPRNITDEQALACAATGGVVGVTGVGIFLGPNTPTLEMMIRHLEYAVDVVGINHVGISSDHSFDVDDFQREVAEHPEAFDESYTRWGLIRWMQPEVFVTLGEALSDRGWSEDDVAAVLGGNFLRVARQSWPSNE